MSIFNIDNYFVLSLLFKHLYSQLSNPSQCSHSQTDPCDLLKLHSTWMRKTKLLSQGIRISHICICLIHCMWNKCYMYLNIQVNEGLIWIFKKYFDTPIDNWSLDFEICWVFWFCFFFSILFVYVCLLYGIQIWTILACDRWFI